MNNSQILQTSNHRPYPLPNGSWSYYQEWNKVIFLHWTIPFDLLRAAVPKQLEIDNYEGKCFISLVPFSMERIRPRLLPPFAPISNFHEINLRTYVIQNGKPGVYFLSIEASKRLSAFISKSLSGLPYEYTQMHRSNSSYIAITKPPIPSLEIEFEVQNPIINKTPLETWLTERYCLYTYFKRKLHRYDIHHAPWVLHQIKIEKLNLDYSIDTFRLQEHAMHSCHYSPGIQVIAWHKHLITE